MSETPTTYGLPKKREEVVEALKVAYANQNLEDQEYERRLHEATNAKSIEDLKLVLFDFPAQIKYKIFPREKAVPLPPPNTNLPVSSGPKIQVVMGEDTRILPELSNAYADISAVLSSQKLDYRISRVPETPINLRVECILSNTQIDLRNENLDGKHIRIHINGALGEIKIMLPRGARIQRDIQLVASEFKIQDKQRSWIKRLTGMGSEEPQAEIQLSVQITGNFWFGNIKLIY